jgi:hypothetical protein
MKDAAAFLQNSTDMRSDQLQAVEMLMMMHRAFAGRKSDLKN